MIDTKALRKKVIELAIQGKLTQQLPEDGNAEELYAQIQEDKSKLIKEGKYISINYIYWYLMLEQLVLRRMAIGGLQPFVSLKELKIHFVPLPPACEQIAIAERLNELIGIVTEL